MGRVCVRAPPASAKVERECSEAKHRCNEVMRDCSRRAITCRVLAPKRARGTKAVMLSPCPQEQMPSQLLSRLRPVLDEDIRSSVTALRNERRNDVLGPVPTHPSHPNEPASNTHPHW